jgi:hypothetical protein
MERISKFFRDNWIYFVGILIGGLCGYLYWSEIGCLTGSCPIASSPLLSVLWGASIGGLLFGIFKKKPSNE